MTRHLSALALDALALDALDGTATTAARAHLAICERCRIDLERAAELRAHFTAAVLLRTLPQHRRRAWSLAWLAVPALGVLAVWIGLRGSVHVRPAYDPASSDLAIKGDATCQVFANRDGQTFAVHDGTPLAAGDRIGFVVTPDGARYLLVASIDGAGAASIYFPYNGTESAPLMPGKRIELPGSIVLDATPGPERVFALFSDKPIAAQLVISQLRTIGVDGPEAIRARRQLDVDARAQSSLVFEKVAP
jgi:hypothetical protein